MKTTNARKNVKRPGGGGGGCGAGVGAFTAGFTAGFTAVCVVAASGGGGVGCEEVVAAREALQEPCGGMGEGGIPSADWPVSSSTFFNSICSQSPLGACVQPTTFEHRQLGRDKKEDEEKEETEEENQEEEEKRRRRRRGGEEEEEDERRRGRTRGGEGGRLCGGCCDQA